MRLTPGQLAAHLAKGLAPIYVVAGDEPLQVQESLDAIRARARKDGYSEREVLEADRYFKWQALVDACASLSLFATRRIVEVRLLSSGPGAEGSATLKALAQQPPQDVLLIVTAGELEWRDRNGGWFAALEGAGASVYAEPLKGAEFEAAIAARLRAAGVQAEPDAVQLLAARTEGNLLAAQQDIEKLKLLYPGQRVTEAELADAVADSARYEAFDLNDRVLAGDAAGAVRSLERLREEGAAVLEILGALAWSLRQLARAAVAYGRNKAAGPAAACESAGIFRKQSGMYIKALPRTSAIAAMEWLSLAARIDQSVKSGQEAQAWEDLLTLILAASGAAGKKSA